MTPREPAPRQKRSLLLSLALGAVLIPAAAYGASSLVNEAPPQTPPPASTTTPPPTAKSTTAGPADIDVACGEEGMELVAAEADGSISEVQRAALDALRDICETEGRPLPAPSTTALPSAPVTVATQPTTSVTAPDDDDDHDSDDDGDHRGHGRGGDDDGDDDRDDDDDHDDDREDDD